MKYFLFFKLFYIAMFKYNKWNPWTEKSSIISFISSSKNYGDGEEKIAKEFNTQPLGQNFS